MKRKMLISIALVMIMLLNCMMPLFVVTAAEGEGIQLNSKLYSAVKASLIEQKIPFTCNDITHTLTLTEENKSKVTEMCLNENAISDLTGLDYFSSLTKLELSGNNLTKDSNLGVLNSLPLSYLDLSTNQLEDVSEIDALIKSIQDAKGTVVLSGQTVTIVHEAIIDEKETSDQAITASYQLPLILEKAGFVKSAWIKQSGIPEDVYSDYAPSLYSITNPINANNNEIKVRIASDKGVAYKGLYKLEIYIYDDPTEAASAANLNPAATNILNGSRFYIYVVVHGSEDTAVFTPDSNLYKAVKTQLTHGQTENPELESYPYQVDANGLSITNKYIYELDVANEGWLVLKDAETRDYAFFYNPKSGELYTWEDGFEYGYRVNLPVEEIIIREFDAHGKVISERIGYEIPVANYGNSIEFDPASGEYVYEIGKDLYIKAYDDAKVFVIKNTVLVNKITSLVLNNKEIRDLSGLEKFVGLESYLNVSHNYLSDIDPIYELQAEKTAFEALLQEEYNYWLKDREFGNLSESLSGVKSNKAGADAQRENIGEAVKEIMKLFKEASEIEKYKETVEESTDAEGNVSTSTKLEINENYEEELKAIVESINGKLNDIYGYWDEDETTGSRSYIKGYMDYLNEDLAYLNADIDGVYHYLSMLYEIYNNEYKLATLLTPQLNYQTLEEYEAYKNSLLGTTDQVKALYSAEGSRLANLYANDALSDFEKRLLSDRLGIAFGGEGNPVQDYFNELFENTPGDRVFWVEKIEEIREVALFAEMANYCLIKRMEEPNVGSTYCYVQEYLKERIKTFELEGINVDYEVELLAMMEEIDAIMGIVTGSIDDDLNGSLEELGYPNLTWTTLYLVWNLYDYAEMAYEYTDTTVDPAHTISLPTCVGQYEEIYSIIKDVTNFETAEEIALRAGVDAADEEVQYVFDKIGRTDFVKTIFLKETVEDINHKGELNLYHDLVALASKFVTNSGEVSRYITLAKLRKLDVSYNAALGGFERISELTGLRELDANADYITDLSEVDWSAMTYLRRLGLAYNYISDIRALEGLNYIRELDVSHNLIAGEFEFNFTNVQGTLKDLDLSYNQITDITDIMEYLDMKSGGHDENYLAREDTININLNNQNIELTVEDPIYLDQYPNTVNIDLPKIFTQLLAIDVNRTAFGETSQNGRVESEGKYVTLNTNTAGDKKGVVEVLAMTGNGTPVDTCVGEGTKATINYTVVARKVNKVTITDKVDMMKLGESAMFKAVVEGENLDNTSVTWELEGNASADTKVETDGKVTIAADETAESIKVVARSTFDTSKTDFVNVTIYENKPVVVTMELTPENAVVKTGATQEFTATVNAPEGTDTAVVWTVEGNVSENTKVSENGVLTVADDETAETLTVKATSKADDRVAKTATVTVEKVVTTVDKVTVAPSADVKVKPGTTQKFTATVEGTNLTDTTVTWSVSGNASANTKVAEDGTLTVAADETAKTLTVTATAKADNTVKATVNVTVDIAPVVDGVELGYKVEDEYLTTVDPKTPVSAFKSELLDNDDYKVVIMKDGKEITSGHVATGMYVQIQDKDGNVVGNGNELLVFQIVVTGDVNGDGVANSLDSIAIKAHKNEVRGQELVGEGLEAADINDDGKVNVIDTKLLLYHRAEVKGYNLNYSK